MICCRKDTVEQFEIFIKKFSLLYPQLELKLINIRDSVDIDGDGYDIKQYMVDAHLSIDDYYVNNDFNSYTQEKAGWSGNDGLWGLILEKYTCEYKNKILQKVRVENEDVVIYGAGGRCLELLYKFNRYNINVKGIAVTDTKNNPQIIRNYKVDVIEKYNKEDKIVISLKDRREADKIKNTLWIMGYHNLYFVNNGCFWEKYEN